MDKYGNKTHLGWNEYSLEVFEAVYIAFRMDKWMFNYYRRQYRHNRIGKWASVRTHGNPKDKDSIIGIVMWLLGNCMRLRAIRIIILVTVKFHSA